MFHSIGGAAVGCDAAGAEAAVCRVCTGRVEAAREWGDRARVVRPSGGEVVMPVAREALKPAL